MPLTFCQILHYSKSGILIQTLKIGNIYNLESIYYLAFFLLLLILTTTLIVILIRRNILVKFKTRFREELNKRITITNQLKVLKDENRKLKELADEVLQKSTIQQEEHKILLDEIKNSQEEILEMYKNIKESEKQYRILAESSQDMIVLVDKNVKITYTNKAFQDNFNLKNEVSAEELLNHFSEKYQKILKDNFNIRKMGNKTKTVYELEVIMPNGEIKPVEVSSNPIIENDIFSGVLLVIRDIKERINNEIELLSKNKKLIEHNEIQQHLINELNIAKNKAEESDRLKTSFLANMSHEVRTPMNGIIGFASLLDKDDLSREKQKQYIRIIQNSTEQLLAIISDIIDFSKIESKELSLSQNNFNLSSFLEEIKQDAILIKEKKEKESINIAIENKTPIETEIYFDKTRLKQILNNIIDNAIKFTDIGKVTISVEQNENSFLFRVKDTGIGISQKNLKIIFERFMQVENSLSRSHSGTGLGLSICKGIINIGGGKIWIESTENVGTTIFFTIPLPQPH